MFEGVVTSRLLAEVLRVPERRQTADPQDDGPLLRRTSNTRAAGVEGAGRGAAQLKLVEAPPVRARFRASDEAYHVLGSDGRQSSASSTPSPSESTASAGGASRSVRAVVVTARVAARATRLRA